MEQSKNAVPRQKSWPLTKKLSPDFVDGLRKNKSLRFADSEGLPLVTVVNIYRSDSCDSLSSLSSNSSITDSAAAGVQHKTSAPSKLFGQWMSGYRMPGSSSPSSDSGCDRKLRFEQRQPSSLPDFHRTLQRNLVCLENVAIRRMSVFATVRVRNIAYEKHVTVRYTVDDWCTVKNVDASYVEGSCDGPTDRFSFTVVVSDDFPVGGKVQFAVSFQAAGAEFWDNNSGKNFSVICDKWSSPKPDTSKRT